MAFQHALQRLRPVSLTTLAVLGLPGFVVDAGATRIPTVVEKNVGQYPSSVVFFSRARGSRLLFDDRGATLERTGADGTIARLHLGLRGSRRIAPEGVRRLAGTVNVYTSADPAKWRTGVPLFERVVYREILPGIDLEFYPAQDTFEYDVRVAPGADPAAVRLEFEGASRTFIDEEGRLCLATDAGEVRLRRPMAFQDIGGTRRPVPVWFAWHPDGTAGFLLGSYDRARPLVIDPVVEYASFVGGSGGDVAADVATDAAGFVYVAGATKSADFPRRQPFQDTYQGGTDWGDVFVAKIDPARPGPDGLLYATYLGGTADDYATALDVDSEGSAYVVGSTSSPVFPTTEGAYDRQVTAGDAFLAKFDPVSGALVYSTLLGGDRQDTAAGVAVDSQHRVWVAGSTLSTDFPRVNAWPTTQSGASEGFVSLFNDSASVLAFSTYLGGTGEDMVNAVALGPDDAVFLTGQTTSANFPTTPGAFQAAVVGTERDAFVVRATPAGTKVYATCLGGSGSDLGVNIAVDSNGFAYVIGATRETTGTPFPTTPNAYRRGPSRGYDAFVTRLRPDGTGLAYSTLLGGALDEIAVSRFAAIGVDPAGYATVGGVTYSTDFPLVNPVAGIVSGRGDGFVARLNPAGSALVDSTLIGGSELDYVTGIAVTGTGAVWVAGSTASGNFGTTDSAFDPDFNNAPGTSDAFILRLAPPSRLPGDVNADGRIDRNDVLMLIRAAGGVGNAVDSSMGDVAPAPSADPRGYGDGRLDVRDAARILRYISGMETYWPA